ncbi:MAG: hypothetical protein ACPIOQ_22120, partial [Promethearchaeia archaeon]
MVDGRNKRTTAATGFKVKTVELDVQYVDRDVLVVFVAQGGSPTLRLVFEKELQMTAEIGKLLRQVLTVLISSVHATGMWYEALMTG